MLVLMMAPYLVVRLLSVATHRDYNARGAAAIGLAVLFIFTGTGRVLLVYLTGVLEFAIAAGFLVRKFRRCTGWAAAAVLIVFFPANIYAAFNHIPMGGHEWGPVYLLIRAPLQAIILLWVYWFTIQRPKHSETKGDR